MAVAVDERLAGERRQREVFGMLLEEFAEQEDLLRERASTLVLWEQVGKFVAEDSGTTGLEHNDRDAGLDFGQQLVHDVEQQGLGTVEHADVVERSPAAEMRPRDSDIEPGSFEHFDRSFCG